MNSFSTLFTRLQMRAGSVVCLCAAMLQAPAVLAQPAVASQAVAAHAEFLASDLLEGRATGSRGYELAAAYVAAQFRQYGLSPLNGASNYLQPVPLIEATVVLPGSAMSLKRDNTITFEFGKDYLPTANFFNANASLAAPLAFVGYGINAPEYQYNDFASVDVQGRVAVLMAGAPERFSETARSFHAARSTKYAELVKQGAQGVIEIVNAQRSDEAVPSDWERAVSASWITEMRAMRSDEQPDEPFPELKLRFRMHSDAAARLFTGAPHGFEQVMQAAQGGVAQGFALPGTVSLSATTGLRRVESNNVVGIVRGSDPQLRNEYVLVTAQLDHLGRGPGVNGDNIYNGLQHNAVGVAMLLDMAHTLATSPVRPRRSIVFAAVTAGDKQEQGLRHLLASELLSKGKVIAAVVMDTPLPLAATADVHAPGARESALGTVLNAVLGEQGLSLSSSEVSADREGALQTLFAAGVPAIQIRSGSRALVRRTDMRALKQTWWQQHAMQPSDDVSAAPVDVRGVSQLASVNLALVTRLADVTERPVWYRNGLIDRQRRIKN